MAEIVSTISSKNQISLPAEVRRRLGVSAGQQIVFVIDETNGTIAVRPPEFTLEQTIGSVPYIPGMSDDFDREIEEAISDYVDAKMERLARQR
jgi:AbrB family looped-hinge helix DNA binding protein